MLLNNSKYYYHYFETLLMNHISLEEWTQIFTHFCPIQLNKGERWVSAGDETGKVGLIYSGVLRLYYSDAQGREYNKSFNGPGQAVAPFAELLQGSLSRTYIEALTDSSLLVIEYKDLLMWREQWPGLVYLILKILENLYIEKEQREFDYLQTSLVERYNHFKQRYIHILSDIPQYHIASYLGVSPETLSRIIKKEGLNER